MNRSLQLIYNVINFLKQGHTVQEYYNWYCANESHWVIYTVYESKRDDSSRLKKSLTFWIPSIFNLLFCYTSIIQKMLVVRQILLVNQFDHHQDFLHAKKRNPGCD